jgi:DtxR family transcriptional regulator, Mn-dependent transcriptional regulator
MRSVNTEDYLKAIYELQAAEGRAKTSHIAEKLRIKSASVTEMIKRLALQRPRLLAYVPRRGVRLTAKGKKAALNIIRRHRLLESFLHKALGLSWDEVHQEADLLEHHLSERLTEALADFLGHPEFDPHGEPIPGVRGEMSRLSQMKLSEANAGSKIRVVGLQSPTDQLLHYLSEHKIGIRTVATITHAEGYDGSITLQITSNGETRERVVGKDATDHILVELLRD